MYEPELIKPRLEKSSYIGFVSPSAGLAGVFKYRVERAKRWFEKQGFKIKLTKNFFKTGYIAGEPEERAFDLNAAIRDNKVGGIICSIGGYHSIQLLKYIDFKSFRKHPKVFVGFSDITTLHLAFYKISKVQTFYGPMVLTQFGEYPKPFDYTVKYFFNVVMRKQRKVNIRAVNYTDQFLDWGKYKNVPRTKFKKNKFVWLREGSARGKLMGGCLPSILRVAGTKYFPSFNKSIVFLETPEGEKPGKPYRIEKVDGDLSQLIGVGVFNKAKGLILGIPYRYTEKMKKEFYQLILKRLREFDFPILANVNFGHTDPIITIPYGAVGTIDSSENSFTINI